MNNKINNKYNKIWINNHKLWENENDHFLIQIHNSYVLIFAFSNMGKMTQIQDLYIYKCLKGKRFILYAHWEMNNGTNGP